ncbi:MAG: hypothetical protein J6S80_03755 [Alphaproteobacteria bacterium]|nr:hypothetical protein [Alphaproteobacteria bacterium]
MEVKQIYELVNAATSEVLGKTDLVSEDLSNIVDVGTEIVNASAVDNYVKSLVNRIGKVIFVNRPYSGKVPSVLMDGWEFGSVLQKVTAEIPTATENESWELTDGEEYKQDVFYKPTVSAKFFNSKVTFEVPISITERQVKESFGSAAELNGFISMLYAAVEKSMTIKTDALVMRTINNMIVSTFAAEPENGEARAINLLALYNAKFGKELNAAAAMFDADFVRFASYTIALFADRFGTISTLFNVGGKARFTSADRLHIVLLSEFAKAAQTYLYGDTYHNEFVKLPNAETVPYWQGSGKNYSFADTATIKTKKTVDGVTTETEITGVLGVMFDRDALGVCNLNRRVTTAYNAKAEFFNNFYKFDAGYFNDTNENFVVFYVATDTTPITVNKTETHATISGLPQNVTVDSVLKLTATAADDYEFTTAPTLAYTTKDGNTVTVSFVIDGEDSTKATLEINLANTNIDGTEGITIAAEGTAV